MLMRFFADGEGEMVGGNSNCADIRSNCSLYNVIKLLVD